MLDRICAYLKRKGRYRLILDRDGVTPYLERYYLLSANRKYLPFNIVIHKILKSDLDDLHDHPWGYATLILRGGYWETTKRGRVWRGPGWFTVRRADSFHRLEIVPGVECWTLFFMGAKRKGREWGFLRDGEWVHYERYLAEREAKIDNRP